MPFSYSPLLVILSVIVAVQAGFVGLSLALQIPRGFAVRRKLLIAGAAITLATGIWSMHFIGMLAVIAPVSIDYLVLPTLLSFLLCVLVVGIAIYLASLRSSTALGIAAVVMGLGIATMHYVGMIAVHSAGHMSHDPAYVAASLVIAFAASGLALWLAFLAEQRPPLLICAIVFGGAVSAMHYTAMAGTALHMVPNLPATGGSTVSSEMIAVIVSIVTCSISGIFMLALLPAQIKAGDDDAKWKVALDVVQVPVERAKLAAKQATADARTIKDDGADIVLPIETKGSRFQIAAREIVSVHANAHYTYIFNGRDDVFCPMSITEITAQLPKAIFFRTHRSHLVNLAFVLRVKRAGDAAVAELDVPARRTVPISRTRIAALKQELAAFRPAVSSLTP